MTRTFGDCLWRLTAEDIPVLKGMAAVHGDRDRSENPFEKLIHEIERLDVIEVWPEW